MVAVLELLEPLTLDQVVVVEQVVRLLALVVMVDLELLSLDTLTN